jgi:hypothetical protein
MFLGVEKHATDLNFIFLCPERQLSSHFSFFSRQVSDEGLSPGLAAVVRIGFDIAMRMRG